MAITLDMPDELTERLAEAGIREEDAARIAMAALSDAADRAEVRAWWEGLSRQEQRTETSLTQASLDAADSGRPVAAKEAYRRIRSKRIK